MVGTAWQPSVGPLLIGVLSTAARLGRSGHRLLSLEDVPLALSTSTESSNQLSDWQRQTNQDEVGLLSRTMQSAFVTCRNA